MATNGTHLGSDTVYTILETRRLSKQYVTPKGALTAVQDISFQIGQGEFVCIVGPSGCGKTTLLRLLAGLLSPDSGDVLLHGETLEGPSRDVGVVFQKANLMPWRTVEDNIRLPLQIQGVSSELADKQVDRVLRLVELTEFAGAYPRELSGGMEQRVAIARALGHDPEILLLDEPFGALDALTRERLNMELLRVWHASQKTVVMITHDIREAVLLADWVLVISQRPGRVAGIVPIDLTRPREPTMVFGEACNRLAQRIRRLIQ